VAKTKVSANFMDTVRGEDKELAGILWTRWVAIEDKLTKGLYRASILWTRWVVETNGYQATYGHDGWRRQMVRGHSMDTLGREGLHLAGIRQTRWVAKSKDYRAFYRYGHDGWRKQTVTKLVQRQRVTAVILWTRWMARTKCCRAFYGHDGWQRQRVTMYRAFYGHDTWVGSRNWSIHFLDLTCLSKKMDKFGTFVNFSAANQCFVNILVATCSSHH